MVLYRKVIAHRSLIERVIRSLKLLLKCLVMLVPPAVLAFLAGWFWHQFLFLGNTHLNGAAENIISSAWIPTFGVLYALFGAICLTTVWNKYNAIRLAVKRLDLDTFVDLRDESLSPLVHTLMAVLSLFLLGGFMSLHYPDAASGLIIVSGTAYLLALVLFVIVEIDYPCSGIWFIKHIPEKWLMTDVREYRADRNRLRAAQE